MTTTHEARLCTMRGETVILHTPIGAMRGILHMTAPIGRWKVVVNGGTAAFPSSAVTEICSKGIHVHLKNSQP